MKLFCNSRRALFGFVALLLAGVAGSTGALAGKADDTINVAFWREVTTLDGMYSTQRENDILGLAVDDSLFYVDSKTLKPVPLLAKSWNYVDDLTLDIELRQDVKFHDGSAVRPEDVAYSLNTIINPKSESDFSLVLGLWLEKASVKDAHTVRLHFKRPYAMALWDLCYYAKIRKEGTYDLAGKPGEFNPNAQQQKLIGSGPYRVVDFQAGRQIVLERFKDYRADSPKGKGFANRIVIRTVPDFSTQAAEVMSGGIDWSYQVPFEIADDVASSKRGQHVSGPSMRIGYIVLDAIGKSGKDNPVTNVKVRQALNHAIDWDSIVKNIVKGRAEKIPTPCNPTQFGCDVKAAVSYDYNPAKAKALLAEAGYPQGFPLELWAGKSKPVVEAIVNQWTQVGIKATLRYTQGSAVSKAYKEGRAAAYFGDKGSYSIPDAGAIVTSMFTEDSDENFHGDKAVAEPVLAAMSSRVPEEREKAFATAIKRITEQAYWIFTYRYSEEYLTSNTVTFPVWEDGMQRLFEIRWK
jgi:peptide/nickel transport system substrate-binding protein